MKGITRFIMGLSVALLASSVGCEYYGGGQPIHELSSNNKIVSGEETAGEGAAANVEGEENTTISATETPAAVGTDPTDPSQPGDAGGATGADTTGGDGPYIPLHISPTGPLGTIHFQFTTELAVQSYTWFPTADGLGLVRVIFSEDVDVSNKEALKKTLRIHASGQALMGSIEISDASAFLGLKNTIDYHLAEAPKPGSDYDFILASGDSGPHTETGKKLAADLTWSHRFSAEELVVAKDEEVKPDASLGAFTVKFGILSKQTTYYYTLRCGENQALVGVELQTAGDKLGSIDKIACQTVQSLMNQEGSSQWIGSGLTTASSGTKHVLQAGPGRGILTLKSRSVYRDYPSNYLEGTWVASFEIDSVALSLEKGIVPGSLKEGEFVDTGSDESLQSFSCDASKNEVVTGLNVGVDGYGVTSLSLLCAPIVAN